MGILALAAAVLIAAVVLLGMSVRFGMLLGRRLDGVLEAWASVADPPGEASATATATAADGGAAARSAALQDRLLSQDEHIIATGQEEIRGE
jgi:hypothetical protein